jgi:excisionase family DNA binding protein
MKNKQVFTTGEVAHIFQVSSRTAAKWIDSGQLVGYKIPGSRDRRVTVESLMAFAKVNSMDHVAAKAIKSESISADFSLEKTEILEDKLKKAKKIIQAAIEMAGPGKCSISVTDKTLRVDNQAREEFLRAVSDLMPYI